MYSFERSWYEILSQTQLSPVVLSVPKCTNVFIKTNNINSNEKMIEKSSEFYINISLQTNMYMERTGE